MRHGNLTLAPADIHEAVTRAPATSAAKKTSTPPFATGHGAAAARLLRATRAAFAAAASIHLNGIRAPTSAFTRAGTCHGARASPVQKRVPCSLDLNKSFFLIE